MGLDHLPSEERPASAADDAPAAADSDSEDDVLGGARGRLARKGATAAPVVDDDLDDLLADDMDVAPGPLAARRLSKGRQTEVKEASKPPKPKKRSAASSKKEKPPKVAKARKLTPPKKADPLPKPAAKASVSDSEDEPIAALGQPAQPTAPAAPSDSEDEPIAGLGAGATAGSTGDASDSDAGVASSSSSDSESSGGEAPPRPSEKKAKRSQRSKSQRSGSSDSDSESDDSLDLGALDRKGKQKKARAPKEKTAKPRKRSPYSESEPESEEPADKDALFRKFGDAPKKDIDVKKLTSQAFLLGNVGTRSTWKLPIFDHQKRINLHLLHHARQVVTTGMLNSKRPAPFAIPASVKERVAKLWQEAKWWHRLFGTPVEPAAEPAKDKGRNGKAAAEKRDADDEDETLEALLHKSGGANDEGETLDSLLQSAKPTVKQPGASDTSDSGSDSDASGYSDASNAKRRKGKGKAGSGDEASREAAAEDDDDEEEAMLKKISEQHSKQKVKERFWRREADFIHDSDDDDDDAEGEEGNVSGAESEALEGNERAKDPFKPLEMGRMNDKEYELYKEQMRSETQRLLREEHAALPCRKEKTLNLGSVLSKIEQRRSELCAEKGQPLDAAADAMAEEEEKVRCVRCSKLLTDGDEPVIDRFSSANSQDVDGDCPVVPLFCSNLCLTLHRQASNMSQQLASQQEEESDDDLIVLPSAPKAKSAQSKKQLRGLLNATGASAPPGPSARGSLIRQLKGSACERKKEEARSSGKFYEEEEGASFAGTFAPMDEADGDAESEGDEADGESVIGSGEDEMDVEEDAAEGAEVEDESGQEAAEGEEHEAAAAAETAAPGGEEGAPPVVASDVQSVREAAPEGTDAPVQPLEDAPSAAATEAEPACVKPSFFGKAFGRRKPQQSKLAFDADAAPASGSADTAPRETADATEDAEEEEEEEEEGSAHEDEESEPADGLIESEAIQSGDDEGGEDEAADDDFIAEDGDEAAEADEEVEGSHAAHLQLQAELNAEDDARETEAVLRGLKRKHGAESREAVDRADEVQAGALEAEEAKGEEDAESDDELRSLDDELEDFIAEDGEEVDIYAQPAVLEEEEDEEDITAKVIRDKLGEHWVCGDRSAPALEVDEDDEESRARALRNAYKRRRQTATESQESQESVGSFFGRDEKSQSMWEMLGEGRSQPALGSGPAAKRIALQRTPSSSSGEATPRPIAPQRSSSAVSSAAAPTAGAAPPVPRRFGSFSDKGRYGGDKLGRLGGGSAASSATFSKGFVFQQDNSSQGVQHDPLTEASSRLGKSAATAATAAASAATMAPRPPLAGVANGGTGARGVSLLSRVLSGSKNWNRGALG